MATLKLTVFAQIDINGTSVEFGSLTVPNEITIGTAGSEVKYDVEFIVPAGGADPGTEVFDVSDGKIADFEALLLVSDQALEMQIVISDDNSPTERFFVITLAANVPFLLGSDDGRASDSATVDLFTGTLSTIDRINLQNSGTTAAQVRVLALS